MSFTFQKLIFLRYFLWLLFFFRSPESYAVLKMPHTCRVCQETLVSDREVVARHAFAKHGGLPLEMYLRGKKSWGKKDRVAAYRPLRPNSDEVVAVTTRSGNHCTYSCALCPQKTISPLTLGSHLKTFHGIDSKDVPHPSELRDWAVWELVLHQCQVCIMCAALRSCIMRHVRASPLPPDLPSAHSRRRRHQYRAP